MQFAENASLDALNSLSMSARARWFCQVTSLADLNEAIRFARDKRLQLLPLGGGTNVVITGDLDALVVGNQLRGVSFDGESVSAASGENWHELVARSVADGLFGIENLALIPGTVGAAPIQNIGAYGMELKDSFVELEAVHVPTGEIRTFDAGECCFSYRDSVFRHTADYFITRVTLALSRKDEPLVSYPGIEKWLDENRLTSSCREVFRAVTAIRRQKLPDPVVMPNVGSFFKNPVVDEEQAAVLCEQYPDMPRFDQPGGVKLSSAWMIDRLGLKGLKIDGFEVSQQHALVIVNRGSGTGEALIRLVSTIREKVREGFGVELETEPVFYP